MLLHNLEFTVGELPGLEQDAVRNAHFTDVMEGAGQVDEPNELVVHLVGVLGRGGQMLGQNAGVIAHAFEVLAGLGITGFRQPGQGENRYFAGLQG